MLVKFQEYPLPAAQGVYELDTVAGSWCSGVLDRLGQPVLVIGEPDGPDRVIMRRKFVVVQGDTPVDLDNVERLGTVHGPVVDGPLLHVFADRHPGQALQSTDPATAAA